ncbi:MAG: DHH family phosphoesterase, partial [Megasphaera massiliensis]|uniref:DHH family phosphoesterase n=1 Tax=Megasphaera massiliensis TaxID=1232428 RepID=UPI002A74E26B
MAKQIFVTGHKNPDTDSICSSIAYAKLKQLQGINAAPIRAGEPNKETAFALNYFNVTPQPLVKDFYVKVSEAVYTDVEGLPINASLKDAAKWFSVHESDVAPVVDNGQFIGVIEKAQLADQFIKTVMGEELSTVKGLVHDPELFFSPTDHGHDVPAEGRYAVVDGGKYVGMVCADSLANVEKQQVILVDHNEKKQIIDGIDEASI